VRAIVGVLAACVLSTAIAGPAVAAAPAASKAYHNFQAAIYVPVGAVLALEDPKVRADQYQRISSQLKFDKVYVEVYRSGVFADDASLEAAKQFFASHGIAVAGGIAYSAPEHGGQFDTPDYESPADRASARRAIELAARHFDEVILDDFFFYSTKSAADIAAKGNRSWTQYRLDRMREVSDNLILKPARAVNPRVKVTIKYPNWYEHFQGLGYDLDQEAKKFDAIYTGTETRDPEITDQLLQQYESYLVFRYFDNIRPGGANRGGWVDTYATRYVDRYAEQLWDTLFAKAPEITLFNWADLARPAAVAPGDRQAWSGQRTSFDWSAMTGTAPGWARVAGASLEQVDKFLGQLGKPIGVAAYKPYQSSGEDFLHNYLGNLGVPIELTPEFPATAPLVLLTESARQDPAIVARIKQTLTAGHTVVITSGLLRALQGKGIEDVVEMEATDRKIAVKDYIGAYGAGPGTNLNETGKTARAVLFPEIRFYTNDSWPLIRGVAEARGVPILVMNRYAGGVLYVLNIPDNPGDLYELPQPVATAIRTYLQTDLPVRLDAPARVSLFAYDNSTFIVESFLSEPASVGISVAGAPKSLRDLVSGAVLAGIRQDPRPRGPPGQGPHTEFRADIPPHSYRVFVAQ
jgi:hypothetical protein